MNAAPVVSTGPDPGRFPLRKARPGPPEETHEPRIAQSCADGVLGVCALGAVSAASAVDFGDRVDRRFDRHGDRIEARLARKGDRIDHRLDLRADRQAALGHGNNAVRLDRKGDRIDQRLDRRGDLADARWDRRGDRVERRWDRWHGH